MATEKELRQSVVNWLAQYKGIKEGSAEHKAILKVFNDSKLCTRYTMTVNDAWCATAVSGAFIACGLSSIFPCVECSCGNMISLASKAGIWKETDSYVPSVGDVILYDWQDSGSGDNTGYPDHVGIVASVSGSSSFTVIEGNMSDTVGTRSMKVNGKYIRGFILPKFSTLATAETSSGGTSSSSSINKTVKWTGYMTETYKPRTWAGASTTLTKVSSIVKNEAIGICDTLTTSDKSTWYYVKIQNKYYGFVPASKVSKTKVSTTSLTATSTSKFVKSGTSSPNKTVVFNGKVKAGTGTLYVRKWAGKENATLTSIPYIKEGTEVEVCDAILAKDGNPWYYVRINKKTYGFCSAAYIVAA